jgi:uncharacterized protein YkwD
MTKGARRLGNTASMRDSTRYSVAVLACAATLFGCGGDDEGGSTTQASKPSAPSGTTKDQGGIKLGKVDGRLGGAITADAGHPGEEVIGKPGPIPDDLAQPPSGHTGVGAGAPCKDPELVPSPKNLSRLSQATLCLMNSERRKNGLPALSRNDLLARASRGHSIDMVKRRYFSHDSPEGRSVVDRLAATHYISKKRGGWAVGENIAWGTGQLGSPRAIVQAWMNSPGHRRNLLSPKYSSVGLGIAYGNPQDGGEGATFTTSFGRKQ